MYFEEVQIYLPVWYNLFLLTVQFQLAFRSIVTDVRDIVQIMGENILSDL